MARKKITQKSAKDGSIKKIENDFKGIPNRLMTHYRQASVLQKRHEKKLSILLKSTQKQLVSVQTKYATLLKNSKTQNASPAIKKQTKSLEKSYAIYKKIVIDLTNQITQCKRQQHIYSFKSEAYHWIKKQITQMYKQPWKKAAKKHKKLQQASIPTHESSSFIAPVIQSSDSRNYNSNITE